MSQDKLPSMQFYPGDWLKDPALRAASSGARGLWIDMLCLMWQARPRGYLQTATGAPLSDEQIARMTGNCSLEEVRGWLGELDELGVFSRTDQGVIYSRRLVREERVRQARSDAGRKGGRNRLLKQNRKQTPSKTQANGQANAQANRGSSSSSSFSTSVRDPPPPPRTLFGELPAELDTPEMRAALADWERHRREIRKPLTRTCAAKQLKRFAEWGMERSIRAIEYTIAQGWQGLREPEMRAGRAGSERRPTAAELLAKAKAIEEARS